MSEQTSNVEFAYKINEQGQSRRSRTDRRHRGIEIAEALALATVAIATAWTGYQATRWEALSARNYALASETNVVAQKEATLAGQDRLYDIVTFSGWIAAKTANNKNLVQMYESRFRSEYRVAFLAWQKLDPFNNPSAPAGPIFMPEYVNAHAKESAKAAEEAKSYFEKGVDTRETGDAYVKIGVFLATVLLLTALSQRFELLGPRIVVLAISLVLLIISAFWIFTFPRA